MSKQQFIGMADAAKRKRLSRTRIHQMLTAGRIPGAHLVTLGRISVWQIPARFTIVRPKK